MFETESASGMRLKHFSRRLLVLLPLALLLLSMSACRKRVVQVPVAAQSPATSPTAPVQTPDETLPPAVDIPAEEPNAEAVDAVALPWTRAEASFARQDFQLACSEYQEIPGAAESALPANVILKAVLSCALASPDQLQRSREWLDQLHSREDLGDPPVLLMAVERLVNDLQSQTQRLAEQKAELERLAQELEKLKKIDSQRRRP